MSNFFFFASFTFRSSLWTPSETSPADIFPPRLWKRNIQSSDANLSFRGQMSIKGSMEQMARTITLDWAWQRPPTFSAALIPEVVSIVHFCSLEIQQQGQTNRLTWIATLLTLIYSLNVWENGFQGTFCEAIMHVSHDAVQHVHSSNAFLITETKRNDNIGNSAVLNTLFFVYLS